MKIIYMGTPLFALKPLNALYTVGHNIVGVVCQPDKINHRGNKIEFCPTKQWAIEHNVPVFQFEKIKKFGATSLSYLDADVVVTCAYGQILPQEMIDLCKYGVINIHSSLLPKYRGASPVATTLLNGDSVGGVTIVKTSIGMDDGDMLLQKQIDVDPDDNSITLSDKISALGAECIVQVCGDIDKYFNNATPQQHRFAVYCTKFTKDDAKIDFCLPADVVVNKIKAFALNPTAYFMHNGLRFKVYNAKVVKKVENNYKCGEVLVCDVKQGLIVACGEKTAMSITQIQAPNGKMLNIKNFLNGKKFDVGEVFN